MLMMNLLKDNIYIKKSIESIIDASKEVGLERNIEKVTVCWCLIARMQAKIGT
jgi:hypothetical protein